MSYQGPGESSEENSISPNVLRAFETLQDFLEEDGWHPRRIEGKLSFTMGYTGENGDLRCFITIVPDVEELLFYAVAPVRVPEAVRPSVAEFITRANYGMRIGNFEMDFADGEVRYKSSLNFMEEELTAGYIRNAIYPAVRTMDRYLLGILRVSFGGVTPFEAIEEIERPADKPEL